MRNCLSDTVCVIIWQPNFVFDCTPVGILRNSGGRFNPSARSTASGVPKNGYRPRLPLMATADGYRPTNCMSQLMAERSVPPELNSQLFVSQV